MFYTKTRFKKNSKLTLVVSVALLVLATMSCEVATKKKEEINPLKYLGTKTPYFPNNSVQTTVPDSLKPVAIAMVTRHGSRFMSGPDEDIALLHLLTKAAKEKQLTETGTELLKSITLLTEIQKNNYGNLSAKGMEEHLVLGTTLAKKYSELLSTTLIEAHSTYKQRTKESRTSFLEGVTKELKDSLNVVFHNNPKGRDPLLRFHKISKSYDEYEEEARFEEQYNTILNGDNFKVTTERIVVTIFQKKTAKSILKGNFSPIYNGEGEIAITKASDITLALYECFKISEGLVKEGAISLLPYFNKSDLEELNYLSNVESFYEKGIGFPDENITYKIASPLLIEFLRKIDRSIKENKNLIYLNFAHAETVAPFAVLTNLQSEIRAQETLPKNYYPEGNFVKMGSNIQWIVYSSNSDKHYIKILYNEKEKELPLQSYGTSVYLWNDVFNYYKNILENMDISTETTDYEALLKKI